jgi:sugar phosphate permease
MSNAATSTVSPRQSGYRWVIMALAATSFTMTFVSRFAWPPLMSAVMPVMGINMTQALAYMTAFYLGYVATQIPGGILADRFGPRLVLSAALILQGLGTFGLGLTENYQVGFLLRVVCGLGAGCVYSSCLKAVVTWFSPVQRGLAIGVIMTSPTLGVTIPNFVLPAIEAAMGWQGAFRGVGLALMALALALLVLMKEIKAGGGGRKSFLVGLKFVLGNPNILLISLSGFSIVWCQIGFGSVANSYLQDVLNVNRIEAGRAMMLYGLTGLLMPTLAGCLCGRLPGRKRTMIISAHLALIAAFLLFGRMETFLAAAILACLVGLLIAFTNPISSVIIADNAGPEWAATAAGVGNCIFQVGALLAPLAVGLARDVGGHYEWTWWILGAGALVGVFTTAAVKNKAVN